MTNIRIDASLLTLAVAIGACTGTSSERAMSETGGNQNSLGGPLAFAPNTVLIFVRSLLDGGVDTSITDIGFTKSLPPFNCTDYDGQFPDSGVFFDGLEIRLQATGQVTAGTYSIDSTDECTLQLCNLLSLYSATDPPSSTPVELATGVSGSITLTSVGIEYAGTFSATLELTDGGRSLLSGTFDTTAVCERAE